MIQNRGISQTVLLNNNKSNINEIRWNTDYDGEQAKIHIDLNENGQKDHINLTLNNEDLVELLNIPSTRQPLDVRLKNDFKTTQKQPFIIDLDKNTNQMIVPNYQKGANSLKRTKRRKGKRIGQRQRRYNTLRMRSK